MYYVTLHIKQFLHGRNDKIFTGTNSLSVSCVLTTLAIKYLLSVSIIYLNYEYVLLKSTNAEVNLSKLLTISTYIWNQSSKPRSSKEFLSKIEYFFSSQT